MFCKILTLPKGQDFYNGIVDQIRRLFNKMDPSKRPKWNASQEMLMAAFGEDDVRWIRPFSTFGMVRESCKISKFLFFISVFSDGGGCRMEKMDVFSVHLLYYYVIYRSAIASHVAPEKKC